MLRADAARRPGDEEAAAEAAAVPLGPAERESVRDGLARLAEPAG
ncbi:hypothetical protein [Streptomyces omiyaensis]|nr:hypothetical protein GCM10010363_65660 [Streptomyces omiyaensis]